MEYYSAIKRNMFESVLMRWMNLEPITPSEASQKEKKTQVKITTNKSSGGDGIPVELFQILKDGAVKVLHSICQQIWKTQQWPQDWKKSVLIPIPKNAQTTTQVHSSHTIVK